MDSADMLAERMTIGKAFVALLAGKPLGAVMEGLEMSAQSEAGAVGLGALGNGAGMLFHYYPLHINPNPDDSPSTTRTEELPKSTVP